MKRSFLREKFMHETKDSEKEIIASCLSKAILRFTSNGRPVFLKEFGIVLCKKQKTQRSSVYKNSSVVRTILKQTLDFQKCGELTSYHNEKFPNLVEEAELARVIYANLPMSLAIQWDFNILRSLLRGLIETIKHETITLGRCKRLPELGEFLSLHNRQGDKLSDWFAGADIILHSTFEDILECQNCNVFERPTVQNAWEIFEAMYGKPIHIFSLSIEDELKKIGYELPQTELAKENSKPFKIAIFDHKAGQNHQLVYCSDGLRNLALQNTSRNKSKHVFGNELVFQVAYDNDFRESAKNDNNIHDDIVLPDWPRRVLALGWILMFEAATKTLKVGSGLSIGVPFCGKALNSHLTTAFATPLNSCGGEMLSNEGAFHYMNLLAISEEEAKFAETVSPHHLLYLLSHRKLDQVTKIGRASILSKTSYMDTPPVKTPEQNNPSSNEKSPLSTSLVDSLNLHA